MKEYVDVEVLKQQDFQDFSNTDVMHAIDHCPRADVESVRHGYWTERTDQSTYINGEKQIIKYCSVCGEAAPYNALGKQFYPARCYCGAKMDGNCREECPIRNKNEGLVIRYFK